MAAEWIPKPIDAPAGDMLTQGEVAKLLRVSEETVKRLVADGELPAGIKIGKQTTLWDWKAVAYYRLRAELLPRLAGAKPGSTEGQRGSAEG